MEYLYAQVLATSMHDNNLLITQIASISNQGCQIQTTCGLIHNVKHIPHWEIHDFSTNQLQVMDANEGTFKVLHQIYQKFGSL